MKSKLYKYKIVKAQMYGKPAYNIMFKKRSIFAPWINIHIHFNTEEEAIKEVDNYIKFDNED